MRRAIAIVLLACLGCGMPFSLPWDLFARPALAQTIETGAGARVAGAASVRVNVRREPVVQDGNIVAQATGGTLLRVLGQERRGSHDWYRIASLPDAGTAFEGWIRGDLLTPAALPADLLPQPVPVTPPPAPPVTDVPLEQRTDWARNLITLMPAIQGCTRIGSAQPITVHHAMTTSRGLIEVIMSDAANRRWHCIITAAGGTPLRYDPLSNAVFPRERLQRGPFFITTEAPPAVDPACHAIERIENPATRLQLGWLYQRTCP